MSDDYEDNVTKYDRKHGLLPTDKRPGSVAIRREAANRHCAKCGAAISYPYVYCGSCASDINRRYNEAHKND